ncbi:MAG: hypothetical protein WBE28_10060 [bacterium]
MIVRGFPMVIMTIILMACFGCMDPDEYKPEDPPQKTDPPLGPSALLPLQDALFRSEYYCAVTLDWTTVDGARGYEFQVDMDSSFTSSYPYQGQFPPASFSAVCFPPVTTYFFRVRAYSDAWTWYTDWSEVRRFHVMPVEDDTIFLVN